MARICASLPSVPLVTPGALHPVDRLHSHNPISAGYLRRFQHQYPELWHRRHSITAFPWEPRAFSGCRTQEGLSVTIVRERGRQGSAESSGSTFQGKTGFDGHGQAQFPPLKHFNPKRIPSPHPREFQGFGEGQAVRDPREDGTWMGIFLLGYSRKRLGCSLHPWISQNCLIPTSRCSGIPGHSQFSHSHSQEVPGHS